MRKIQEFIPITVDIYRGEEFLAAFRCENSSLVDGGAIIGEVTFAGRCADPTVIVDSNVTVSIGLDLHVLHSDQEQECSTVTVGPQRLELFSDLIAGELFPFLRLLNVDSCNDSGPPVHIRLSTSTNASIVLHPDGSNETVGDISVSLLPCNHSHTQEYRVSVFATENYTLYGEIVNALLPTSCIRIPVPANSAFEPDYLTILWIVLVTIFLCVVLWCCLTVFMSCLISKRKKDGRMDKKDGIHTFCCFLFCRCICPFYKGY